MSKSSDHGYLSVTNPPEKEFQPPPGSNIIPPHCNPVDFMMSQASGNPSYRPLTSLQEAKAVEHGVLTMVADSGGQVLLSIPAKQVNAAESVLQRLLADLESITWGNGFDAADVEQASEADMYFQVARPGTGLWGGMGGGIVTDELWLHSELEDYNLREQVSSIMGGQQDRLRLPLHFPNHHIPSLDEARKFRRAQVILRSGRELRDHIRCPASLVKIAEADLYRLIDLIDSWSAKMWPYVGVRDGRPKIVAYAICGSVADEVRGVNFEKVRLGFDYLEAIRPQIESMLAGTRPMIPFE